MKKQKQISLKKSVFKMIILYWAVPILVILVALGVYSNIQVKNTFLDEITITINSSMEISEQNLSYLIQESKKATYDEIIEEAYLEYKDNGELIDLYRGTITYLRNSYQFNSYISETILLYCDVLGQNYSVSGSNSTWDFSDVQSFVDNYYDYIMEISDEIGTYFKFLTINGDLFLIRNLVNSSFDPFAILIFKIDTDVIFSNMNNLPFAVASSLSIDGDIYDIMKGEDNLWDYSDPSNLSLYELSSDHYLYSSNFEVDDVVCEYRILIDTEVLQQNYFTVYILVCLVLAAIIPLIIMTSIIFYKQFSVPLRTLVHGANKIENGEIGYQIKKIPESVEFSYLYDSFNNMSYSMQSQIDLIYKEQEALQNAKIKALQSQINPHFLNNTLEVINWEMRLGENQNAIQMIESLSTMLNASIARNENTLKSLKEELIYVNAYLYIVQTRMGKRLNIIKEIDESVTEYKVPLLLLQPIVENSIEHGIANRTSGTIIIRVYEKNDRVYIEVENDNELKQEDKDRIEKLLNWDENAPEGHIGHTSLGIRNVNERIKLIFGNDYKLTITSTENNSTISQIILPKL